MQHGGDGLQIAREDVVDGVHGGDDEQEDMRGGGRRICCWLNGPPSRGTLFFFVHFSASQRVNQPAYRKSRDRARGFCLPSCRLRELDLNVDSISASPP